MTEMLLTGWLVVLWSSSSSSSERETLPKWENCKQQQQNDEAERLVPRNTMTLATKCVCLNNHHPCAQFGQLWTSLARDHAGKLSHQWLATLSHWVDDRQISPVIDWTSSPRFVFVPGSPLTFILLENFLQCFFSKQKSLFSLKTLWLWVIFVW